MEEFKKFLGGRKILIVDGAATVRTAIAQVFSEHGIKPHQLILAMDYKEAHGCIKPGEDIGVLISDFIIGSRSGVELAEELFAHSSKSNDVITLILTSNAGQSSVIEAAEGFIDAYILKPFVKDTFIKYLTQVATRKNNPSEYESTVFQLRSLMKQKKFLDVLETVQVTLDLFPPKRPGLLYVYRGQACQGLERHTDAIAAFSFALHLDKNNYLSLFGLFTSYRVLGDKTKAYEMISYVTKLFPLNPQRLCEIITLAIETRHYDDVARYHQYFMDIDERREELVRTMAAALAVGGIHNLQSGEKAIAIDLFRKAIVTSRRHIKIVYRSIVYTLAHHEFEAAAEFFTKYEPKDHLSNEYLNTKFLVQDIHCKSEELNQLLGLGMQLINEEKAIIQVARAVLKRLLQLDKQDLWKATRQKALLKWSENQLENDVYFLGETDTRKTVFE